MVLGGPRAADRLRRRSGERRGRHRADTHGGTEVSDALQQWLASIPAASAANPITVRFQPNANYWLDYTLLLRKRAGATGGIVGNMWRALAGFDLSNVTLDLNGATLQQRTTTPWRYGNGAVLDARKRWGNPMLFTAGATNVRITNGTLVGSQTGGRYDPDREDWMGILIGGDNDDDLAASMRVDRMTIRNVWGDFVYLASQTSRGKLLKDVTIEDNTMRSAGRHGIVIHGGTNVAIRRNTIVGARRITFDSEPAAVHGWQDVAITDNTVTAGSLGFFQYIGQRTSVASGLTITNNTITRGHCTVEISNNADALRDRLVITGNRSTDPDEFRRSVLHRSLISVWRWSGVTIADNSDRVHVNSRTYAVSTPGSVGTVARNDWTGAAALAAARPVLR
ncbi:MAG: right-handed parallel beta-helix repeat-containing protein [Actinomycetota bacterium]